MNKTPTAQENRMRSLSLLSLLFAICTSAVFASDSGAICPPGFYSKQGVGDQVTTCENGAVTHVGPVIGSESENSPKLYSYQMRWGASAVTVAVSQGTASPFFVQGNHSVYECEFANGTSSTRISIQDDAGSSGMVAPISDDSNGVKTLIRFAVSSKRMGEHLVLSQRCVVDEQSTRAMTITKVVTVRTGEPQIIPLPDGSELIVRVTAP